METLGFPHSRYTFRALGINPRQSRLSPLREQLRCECYRRCKSERKSFTHQHTLHDWKRQAGSLNGYSSALPEWDG